MTAEEFILKHRRLGESELPMIISFSREEIIKIMDEYAESKAENLPISDVSTFLKWGWIEAFDDSVIKCTLRKDHELDEELTFGRGLLTPEQNEIVCKGLVLRYNKQSNSIQFLLEDGVNWC